MNSPHLGFELRESPKPNQISAQKIHTLLSMDKAIFQARYYPAPKFLCALQTFSHTKLHFPLAHQSSLISPHPLQVNAHQHSHHPSLRAISIISSQGTQPQNLFARLHFRMSHAPLNHWHGCFPITDWNNPLHLIRNVFNHLLLYKGHEIPAQGHPSQHRISGHSQCELLVICLLVTAGLPLYALHLNEVFLGFWNLPGWRTDISHSWLSFSVYETEIRTVKLDRNNLHSLLHSSWLEPELQCTLAVDFFTKAHHLLFLHHRDIVSSSWTLCTLLYCFVSKLCHMSDTWGVPQQLSLGLTLASKRCGGNLCPWKLWLKTEEKKE